MFLQLSHPGQMTIDWEVDEVSQAMITWFGHSCFQVEMAGSSIVLDPYGVGAVPGLRLPDLNADTVHISHEHTDHNAAQRVLCTGRPLNFVAREVPGDHDHHDGARRGKNKILVMEGEGLRIVHMGDQGRLLTQEQIDAIGKPDLLMLPVGGYYTINADEAHQIMEQLQPTVTVPMHYRHNRAGHPGCLPGHRCAGGPGHGEAVHHHAGYAPADPAAGAGAVR